MMSELRIKVCGMRESENIRQLCSLNIDYIGFIFYPKSKRYAETLDADVVNQLPAHIKKTGVFVNASKTEVYEKIENFKLDAIQLHGSEVPDFCSEFHAGSIQVIKAFGVHNDFDFSTLKPYEKVVDYFLFDTKTEQFGGSGETFDWNVLSSYSLSKPYFLSGGLSPDNLSAVSKVHDDRLYAIDLNSRFEVEPGLKDIQKLNFVIRNLKVPY